jgi:hypothetical protein
MNSKNIEAFLNFYDKARASYTTAYDKVNQCDKLTQDLLHKLELENVSTSEKNKIATQLKYCRKDRRYWKDIVEELEPFIQLFNATDNSKKSEAEVNKRFINLLREALGKTRRQEAYHTNRSYRPRIIKTDSEVSGKC